MLDLIVLCIKDIRFKGLKGSSENKEYDKAEKMIDKLIDDTKSGIEDN